MTEARLMETTMVAVDAITVSNRLRPASPASVQSLKASLAQLGHVLAPVILRRKGQKLILIGGLTRLTAVREMGHETIRGDIWRCDDAWARVAEIDENLAGGELSMLEKAVFLAERKRIYIDLHPSTANGGDRRSEGRDQNETVSFCSAIAEKMGISRRRVEQFVNLGETIEPAAAEALMGHAVSLSYRELMEIGGLDGQQQRDTAALIAEGHAKNAAEALVHIRKLFKPKNDAVAPEERAFQKLSEQFDRAPMAAKRRFIEHLTAKHPDLMTPGAAMPDRVSNRPIREAH